MAAGQLVPHRLPDGRTVMVPDYLAPKGLAMSSVPAPAAAPDMRVAGPGGGLMMGEQNDPIPVFEPQQPSPDELRRKLMGDGQSSPAGDRSHKAPEKRDPFAPKPAAKVDPSTLARPAERKAEQSGEGDGEAMDPLVRQVFNESLRGGRGGGGRGSPALTVGSMRVEREPGKELLPELKWRYGLEGRPDLGRELDPDAEQPTWGNTDPVTRERRSPLEQQSAQAGRTAGASFESQELDRQTLALEQRRALAEQANLIDSELATIGERRDRIAKLQDESEKRLREAESFEPRTREQVWEEKGPLAQTMGILAMAIGGYTQGLGRSGGKNPGFDLVNKVLDEAVEGDRRKGDRRRQIGLDAKNDYEKALALYGDTDMAALDAKNRKLASVLGMARQQMADRALDMSAKQRAAEFVAAAEEQVLMNAQQLYDMMAGKVVREELNYKPGAVGGGGGGNTTLKAIEDAARAKKGIDTISGQGQPAGYQRSVESDKLNDVNGALEALDAADAVARDLRSLGAEGSDLDDPLSGPLDSMAKVVGTGGAGRRSRQSLEANTGRLARGIQQSLGKSDNDARLADQMAVGDGSGLSRLRAAETARRQALGRIQTATAGMTPQQRDAFLQALPPERQEMVREAMTAVATPRRAASEKAVE